MPMFSACRRHPDISTILEDPYADGHISGMPCADGYIVVLKWWHWSRECYWASSLCVDSGSRILLTPHSDNSHISNWLTYLKSLKWLPYLPNFSKLSRRSLKVLE
jgi:hypothetical protein